MYDTWKLSGLFVYLEGLTNFFSDCGTENIAGLCFGKGDQYPGWDFDVVYDIAIYAGDTTLYSRCDQASALKIR